MKLVHLVAILLTAFTVNFANAAKTPELKREIVSIKGLLYYHGTGEWSQNIFDKDFHIWNPVIGEGTLKGAADRTMFVIEARGESGDTVNIKIVQQFRKNKPRVLVDTKKSFSFLEKDQTMKIPILVEDVYAGEVTVTATVTNGGGKEVSPEKTAKVVYGGGE